MSRPKQRTTPKGEVVWTYRFRLPPDWLTGEVHARQITCRSAAECLRREREILLAHAERAGRPQSRQRVGEYLRYYIEEVAWTRSAPHKARGTQVAYHSWLRHIEPALGHILLGRLDSRRCQAWVRQLHAGGAAPKTIALYAGLLRSALHHAMDAGIIDRDPMRAVVLPAGEQRDRPVWSQAEASRFLAHAQGDIYHPIWRLAALTGMRQGELVALRWADIDLEGGRVSVARSYRHENREEGATKSGRSRSVFLDAGTLAQLRDHWAWQQREIQGRPGSWPASDLVCRSLRGTRLWPSALRHRLRVICTLAGVPYITFHGLRRVHSTRLLAAGADIDLVARRLGHARPEVTRRHYLTIEDAAQMRLAEQVPQAVLGEQEQPVRGSAEEHA